jgi:hypothetical protein
MPVKVTLAHLHALCTQNGVSHAEMKEGIGHGAVEQELRCQQQRSVTGGDAELA